MSRSTATFMWHILPSQTKAIATDLYNNVRFLNHFPVGLPRFVD